MLALLLPVCLYLAPNIFIALFDLKSLLHNPRKTFSWWIFAAICLQLLSFALFTLWPTRSGNFLLHAIGGGSVTTLLCFHIKTRLQFKLTFIQELAMLFLLVSAFATINELLEFAFDMLHFGPFSTDRLDTWFDILANTSGAIICWLFLSFILHIYKQKKAW